MNLESFGQILGNVHNNVGFNADVFQQLILMRGGWEKWLQGQLYASLLNPTTANRPNAIGQEVSVYDPAGARQEIADFVLICNNFAQGFENRANNLTRRPPGGWSFGGSDAVVVELKCRSAAEADNPWFTRVAQDLQKLRWNYKIQEEHVTHIHGNLNWRGRGIRNARITKMLVVIAPHDDEEGLTNSVNNNDIQNSVAHFDGAFFNHNGMNYRQFIYVFKP